VVCRALDEYGTGGRVPYIFYKGILVLAQHMLVYLASISADDDQASAVSVGSA